MNSLRKIAVIGLASASLVTAGIVSPAVAGPAKPGVDSARLDRAAADYTQYRRYHRGGGNRGAAIAAGIGLGILGAAAIAANRGAYADSVYDDGPGYGYAPDYGYEPGYVRSYAPVHVYEPRQRYYRGRGHYSDMFNGAPDPARGGSK
jgi:hypothetical protein